MANEIAKGTLFFKEVLARVKGDDAEATAAKVARKAISAITAQISAQKAQLVDDEQAVEDSVEKFNNVLYPSHVPSDNKRYCAAVADAQASVDSAQAKLESTQKSIKFFESLLDKVLKEDGKPATKN